MNATTTVSVLRDDPDARDEYGDPVSNSSPVATGVPFSIRERTIRAVGRTSGEPEVVRFIVGRSYPTVDIRRGDCLVDERRGGTYLVDTVTKPQSPAGTPDWVYDLRQVDG